MVTTGYCGKEGRPVRRCRRRLVRPVTAGSGRPSVIPGRDSGLEQAALERPREEDVEERPAEVGPGEGCVRRAGDEPMEDDFARAEVGYDVEEKRVGEVN